MTKPFLPCARSAHSPVRLGALALSGALLAGCVVAPMHAPRPRPILVEPARLPPAAPLPAEGYSSRMYFYPERGQSEAAMDRDRYECYRWAVAQSGTDPGMAPLKPALRQLSPEAVRDGSQVVGGAAAGALVGAAVSSPRHAGDGAVIGAVFGALLGASAQEARAQAVEQRQAQRQEARQEATERRIEPFRRAMGACMSGRGYRVG